MCWTHDGLSELRTHTPCDMHDSSAIPNMHSSHRLVFGASCALAFEGRLLAPSVWEEVDQACPPHACPRKQAFAFERGPWVHDQTQ